MIDWNDYLHSLCNDYAQWWNTYTLTDVVGQQRIEQKHSPPLLDFMVQTMQSAKEQRSANQEKVERLEVLAGLRKYAAQEHVLLIGRPGSGKSTALARLLLEEAKKPLPQPLPDAERGASPPSLAGKGVGGLGQIPILVELRYYQTSVLDLIRDFLKRHRLLIDTATIEQLLCQGQLLLLVDGINELPSEKARQDLYKFRQDYQKTTPMIFTTRDLGVGGDLGIREKLEMQPLTAEQMQQFVRAYLPAQGEQMLQNLGDRLREFGETPLLLWMLCSLFAQTGDIPPNLGLVFRQFTQSYERQFRQDIPVTDESRRWWLSLLKHLAFYMTTGNKLTELNVAIPRLEAEEVLTQFLQAEKFDKPRDRALAWLQDLLNHHLIQLGANDKIEFRHQLIQEYYTAECLLKLLPSLSDDCLQHDYLNYLKWTEPLALMLALIDDESQAVQVVKLALEVDLRLGARLAGEVKQEFQEKTVELVLGLNISQEIKFYLLGQTGSKQALPALLEAWNNPYYKDFYTIAEALQSVGYDEAMSAILKWEDEWFYELGEAAQYEEEANDNLCEDIVDQLQNISSSNIAVYELVSLLSDKKLVTGEGSSYYFQGRNYKAKQILGETVFNKAIAILLQALNHKDFRVRYQAAFALGNIGSETEVTALIKTVKDENYFVCLSAIDALGKIESLKSVSVLIQALNDEKPVVRSRAAAALGNIGCDQAVFALIKLLGDEKYFVRLKATEALGKIRGDMAISGLIEALKDEDSEVRIIAAQALGNIGSYLSVDPLISALQDEQLLLRSIAMYSLLKIREKLIIESLDNTDCLINFDEIINNFYPFQKQAFRKNAATTLAKICNDCLIYILNTASNS
ncbi:MAG: HEAT repeat domain-containing protein [Trichormus sp.]